MFCAPSTSRSTIRCAARRAVLSLGVLLVACNPAATEPPQPLQAASLLEGDPTLRSLAQGDLTGFVQDNGSLAWLKIPYARPPVGELRWKLPQPAQPWRGIYTATDNIQPCPQFASGLTSGIADPDGDGIVGDEDCLYLSVFAPQGASADNPLPVMYWIFGGGNNSGYAGDYNGAYLAQAEQVVVVTVNYRLGTLGWFIHPAILDDGASGAAAGGNWSTMDTIAGLEWVQDNIAVFGGDPANVTVFGESAGGSNVMSLVTSPRARGLFHKAIVQSGGIGTTTLADGMNFADDPDPGHFNSSAEIVGRILIRDGLAADREQARELQLSMSPEEIRALLYSQKAADFLRLYNPGGSRNYPAPKKFRDGVVFVDQDPLAQLASGEYYQVPMILGTNRDERRIYMYQDPHWAAVIRENPDEYVRSARYVSDRQKLTGVDQLARLMSEAQAAGVFAYRFDWDEQRVTPDGIDMAIAMGAAHSTEMAFVFGDWDIGFVPAELLYDPATNSGRDRLSRAMMSYWSNFAYTGDPGRGRGGDLPQWQAWQNGEGNPKMIMLDSVNDGGIRMSGEEVTLDSIKARFLQENFADQANLCVTYRDTFFGTEAFDSSEYATLGAAGCEP